MSREGREIELKLDLAPEAGRGTASRRRKALCAALPATTRTRRLRSRYFDTDDQALRRHGLTLRVRQDGATFVQTVKASGPGGLFDRAESENALAGDEPDLSALPDRALAKRVVELGRLAPVFVSEIERTTWSVSRGGAKLEVALDEGRVVSGDRSAPIAEIEIELIDGPASGLFGLARELAATGPMGIGALAKSERGYRLIGDDEPAGAAKADPVPIDSDATAGEAFAAVARACLRHFRLNEAGLLDRRDPEHLHQARVALRRLRSALSIFADVIGTEGVAPLKAELRAVSALLGQARNLDVYETRRLRQEAESHPDEPGLAGLSARIERDRGKAYDRVVRRLRSRGFRLMTIDLVAFVEDGAWRRDPDLARERDQPAEDFARALVRRRWRKLRKAGRHLVSLDAGARHEIRIRAKKLRYAAEFFSGLVHGKAARRLGRLIGALENLQGALGELNDIATGRKMAEAMARDPEAARGSPEVLFAAGHVGGTAEAREEDLLAAAAKAHRTLRKAKPVRA